MVGETLAYGGVGGSDQAMPVGEEVGM
jgi:hypothetical protein